MLAILALTLCSCPGVVEATEQSNYGPVLPVPKKEVSSINVDFEASSEELAAVLNKLIGKDIYRGSTGNSGVNTDIIRNGPIGITAADDYLYLTMPVTMSMRYGVFSTPAISTKFKFRLNARITPDWKLHAEIYYLGLSDLFAEKVGIGPLSIKPRSVIEGITDPLQRVISDAISRELNARYSLKAQVGKAWTVAQQPVLLDRNYHAWLKITPQEIILYPLYARNNLVKLSLGLKSVSEMVVGPEPAVAAPVSLPYLKLATGSDKSFRIVLNTDLFYKDILNIATPLLLNKELGTDGKSIILKDLDIYSKDDRLIVKVDAIGSYEGVFYLTCKPSFDPQTNVFSVEDVDFDMSTHSFLLKTAGWLFHSRIRNIIREKITVNLTQRMEQALETAQKAMTQVKLADHIFLKGNVNTIKLHDVILQKDKICIQLYTEGETTLVFR